jgi:hypothetical protein
LPVNEKPTHGELKTDRNGPKEVIVKTRIKPITLVMIAASIMFPILTSNVIVAFQSRNAVRPTGLVAGALSEADMDFLSLPRRSAAVPGVYDLSFRKWRNGVLEPVSSLLVGGGPLVLFAHVEDTNGNPAQSGTVTLEYCGNYEPNEMCEAGLASWTRPKSGEHWITPIR